LSGGKTVEACVNARLNVLGRHLYENEWFKELNFPHRNCHSIVLVFNDVEKKELHKLYDQGITNGLRADELEILSGERGLRMDNVGFVVDDLAAAIAFFVELGLELEGETTVEGLRWIALSGSTTFERT
jgi:hypothetical protein